MFGKKSDAEDTIALSQDELDKILKQGVVVKPKKTKSKSLEEKIKLLKEKTSAVSKKIQKEKKATQKNASKKNKSTSVKKKVLDKISIYYEGKLFGYGIVSKRNGKKIIELRTIKK